MIRIHLTLVLVYVVLHFILSMVFVLIPGILLRTVGLARWGNPYIRMNGVFLSRMILWTLGAKVRVEGLEHLPDPDKRLCFMSNHRSLIDIPLLIGCIPIPMGFIAKKELRKIPILKTWMEVLGCVYIDRGNPRSQLKAIIDGANAIRNGQPQLIFPEGTRSRDECFGIFKEGSVKLATRAEAVIVPITVTGTSRLLESKESVSRQVVRVQIHPPIDTAGMSGDDLRELPGRVFSRIKGSENNC